MILPALQPSLTNFRHIVLWEVGFFVRYRLLGSIPRDSDSVAQVWDQRTGISDELPSDVDAAVGGGGVSSSSTLPSLQYPVRWIAHLKILHESREIPDHQTD